MPPLRLLFFRRLYSALSEPFLHDLVTSAAGREDVEARLACLLRLNADERPFPTWHLLRIPPWVGTALTRAPLPGARKLWQSDTILWPAVRRILRRWLRAMEVDVVHAHFGPDGYLIAPVARELGLPVSVGFYGYDMSSLLVRSGRTWRPRYRRLFEQASLLVAISSHVAERLVELGAPQDKVRVLPLGCPLERFTWRDRGAGYDGGPVRCVHVGRLTTKKDPVALVRAFDHARRILAGEPELELTIAGGGELERETRREVAARGLDGRVTLLGPVGHDRIPALLDGAHLYAQHCRRAPDGDEEGQGISLVEASASGLPLVTTDHAGIRDVVVPGETGLVSPEGDAEAMGANLARLARDPARWSPMGRAGHAHVLEHFELGRTTGRLVAALRGLVDAGGPGGPLRGNCEESIRLG